MKIIRYTYFIVSIVLLIFLGRNYYKYQFDKKIIYADKSKEDLISYFYDICLGAEYGNLSKVTRKWKTPLKIFIVKDNNYKEQTDFIQKSIEEINKLVSNNFKISISKDSINANGHLFLCSDDKLKTYPAPYNSIFKSVNNNYFGFVNFRYHNNIISKATIFINTSKPIEYQKSAILEEIVQSLGFGNDSHIYSNSVFYESKNDEQNPILNFSEIDKKLIQILYNSEIKVGLNRLETDPIIRNIIDNQEL